MNSVRGKSKRVTAWTLASALRNLELRSHGGSGVLCRAAFATAGGRRAGGSNRGRRPRPGSGTNNGEGGGGYGDGNGGRRRTDRGIAGRGIRLRKQLGQHILPNAQVLSDLVTAARLADGDRVLEIGPGTGNLTAEILSRNLRLASLVAVEVDPAMAAATCDRLAVLGQDTRLIDERAAARGEPPWQPRPPPPPPPSAAVAVSSEGPAASAAAVAAKEPVSQRAFEGKKSGAQSRPPPPAVRATPLPASPRPAVAVDVAVWRADALVVPLPSFDVLVSNPPFGVSKALIGRLLAWPVSFRCAVLLLQDDFVQKLVAAPGHPKYGAMSVLSQHFLRLDVLRPVPPGSFMPPPKVPCRVLRLSPRPPERLAAGLGRASLARFGAFLSACFRSRNKLLPGVVARYARAAAAAAAAPAAAAPRAGSHSFGGGGSGGRGGSASSIIPGFFGGETAAFEPLDSGGSSLGGGAMESEECEAPRDAMDSDAMEGAIAGATTAARKALVSVGAPPDARAAHLTPGVLALFYLHLVRDGILEDTALTAASAAASTSGVVPAIGGSVAAKFPEAVPPAAAAPTATSHSRAL